MEILHTNPKRYKSNRAGLPITDLFVGEFMNQPIVDFILEEVQNNEPLIKFINSIEQAKFEGMELFDNSVTDLGYIDYIELEQSSAFTIKLIDKHQLVITCKLATLSIKINYDQTYILDLTLLPSSNPSKYRLQEVYTLCKYLEDMRLDYSKTYQDFSQID